jgi:hypothetical protein
LSTRTQRRQILPFMPLLYRNDSLNSGGKKNKSTFIGLLIPCIILLDAKVLEVGKGS